MFGPYLFGRGINLVPYFLRRFFRIYPLYLVALAAYVGLHISQGKTPEHVVAHVLMLHTFSRDVAFHYNPAFWSLPAEVEFYLLLPLLSWLVRRITGFWIAFGLTVGIHFLVTSIARSQPDSSGWSVAVFHFPGLLCEFFVGAIGWRIASSSTHQRWHMLAGAAGLLWVLALAWYSTASASFQQSDSYVGSFVSSSSGLLAALGYMGITVAVASWVQSRNPIHFVSEWAGNLSYGIYLFHNFALSVVVAVTALKGTLLVTLAFILTLALAWLGHVTVERKFRHVGRSLAARIDKRYERTTQLT